MAKKIREVLFSALVDAKDYQLSLMDAYADMDNDKYRRKAERMIRDYTNLQEKLFGTSKTALDGAVDNMVSVDISDIRNLRKLLDEILTQ